ncbi:MAG TPA: amidohydrolase family protein, partial [Longimicrobiales bacterium]|nr:amidohydrolase family protein [Longimicrobiales bacterium]
MQRTIYSARWIATGASAPLANAAMLVSEGGNIEMVAPQSQLDDVDAQRKDFGEAMLIPGLVNVHAHPELSVFRGLLDDLPFHQWIPTLMRCKRGAALTAEDYEVAAQWTCVELLRAGVTLVGATEDSGAAVKAFVHAGLRGLVYLETFGPSPDQASQSLSELRMKVETRSQFATDAVRIGVSPHAPYTVSDNLFAMVAEYAKAENFKIATHAAEAETEDLLVREGLGPFAAGLRSRGIETASRGRSTIDVLSKTGILDQAPLLIHAVRVSADDLEDIQQSGSAIAHCPIANARLGHGNAPIVEALEKNIRVGIGTDSVASNNRLDLLEEARVAQIGQRARLQSASALPARQLLDITTRAGAEILGFDVGALEAGKAADFCVVRLDGAHATPSPDPLNALFHAARGSDVSYTVVEGRVLFDGQQVLTLDENDLRERVNLIA